MGEQETAPKTHGNYTYRVLTDSIKIMGILDWRYALFCVVAAAPCGLFAQSWIVGAAMLALFVWMAWHIGEEDPKLPEVRYATFRDKKRLDPFRRDRTGKGD